MSVCCHMKVRVSSLRWYMTKGLGVKRLKFNNNSTKFRHLLHGSILCFFLKTDILFIFTIEFSNKTNFLQPLYLKLSATSTITSVTSYYNAKSQHLLIRLFLHWTLFFDCLLDPLLSSSALLQVWENVFKSSNIYIRWFWVTWSEFD